MTGDPSLDGLLPPRLVERLGAAPPAQARFDGAALFADISGYTALTERLVARGEEGLETLRGVLNTALSHYVHVIQQHGGEVTSFAGDALLAYWPAASGGHLGDVARRATQCAEALHQGVPTLDGAPAAMLHCGVGCGELWATLVGAEDYAHIIFGGSAVRQATRCGAGAQSGRTARSDATESALEGPPLAKRSLSSRNEGSSPPSSRSSSAPPSPLVPRAVAERAAGDTHWSAELRHTIALFVRVEPFDEDASDALDRIDCATRLVQGAQRRFSASCGQWLIDDKGLVFLVVFGVPANSHNDDLARALGAGVAIHQALAGAGFRSSAGVAAGKSLCGFIGPEFRRQYVTIGRAMNIAARLMAAGQGLLYAGPPPSIEPATIELGATAALRIKGYSEPITASPFRAREAAVGALGRLYGRDRERDVLLDALERARAGQRGAVVIQGDAGAGKSHLVADFVERARQIGVRVLTAENTAGERTRSFALWLPILFALLGAGSTAAPDLPRWFDEHPDLAPFAPLLASVLRIEHAETDATRHLEGPLRRERTVRFLAEVLDAAAARPLVIVLEDCHWMDADSFRLARAASGLPGVLVLLTSRPGQPGVEERALREERSVLTLALEPLPDSAIDDIVRHTLATTTVTEGLLRAVRRRAAGSPLVAREYVLLLRQSGRARREGGHWVFAQADVAGNEPLTPDPVRGLIASRVDALSATQGRVLKAAAAVGPAFTTALLEEILDPEARDALPQVLTELVSHELVAITADGVTYTFRHDLIREVVYDLMLVAQRRQLHADIATALERRRVGGDPVDDALLARHWFHVGDHGRTRTYAASASYSALQGGAYREAIYFLGLCLKYAPEPGSDGWISSEHVRWRRQLADAHHALGNLVERRREARRALEVAHCRAPESTSTMVASVVGQLLREVAMSGRPVQGGRSNPRNTLSAEALHTDLAKVYRHFVELAYFDNDGLGMLWGALRAAESADRAGMPADRSLAYAQLGGALGLVRAPFIATHFLDRAVEVAREAGEPHAEAYAHMCSCLYMVGIARWEDVRRSAAACEELAERTRDSMTSGNAQVVRFWMHYYRDETVDAVRTAMALRERSARLGNVQQEVWALRCQGLLAARQHDPTQALGLLEEARALLADTSDKNERIAIHGALALARLGVGDASGADASMRTSLALAGEGRRPTSHVALNGFLASVEVLFALRERRVQTSDWARLAGDAIATLRRYQRVFVVAEPAYFRWRGAASAARGDARAALADFRRGLRLAESLGMRWDAQALRRRLRSTEREAGASIPPEV